MKKLEENINEAQKYNNARVHKLLEEYTEVIDTKDPETGKTTVVMDFDYAKIKGYQSLKITYTALLNEAAVIGTPGNPNEADLTYSHDTSKIVDGKYETKTLPKDETVVYTYGLDITKYELGDPSMTLAGAEFSLKTAAGKTVYFKVKNAENNIYTAIFADVKPEEAAQTVRTSTGGKLIIEGLGAGIYTLTEEAAPTDYHIIDKNITVNITPELNSAGEPTGTLTQDAGLERQARENSISTGKAALVNRVLALNATLKFDALAKLSVEELKDLAEAGAPAMPIGKEAAAYAAEQYAGTTALDSVTAEVDSELDESPAHYEVELHAAWGEFEYLVDAYTGKVLSGQKNLLTAASTPNETTKPSDQKLDPSGTAQDIGHAKAKSIALNHAGVSENEAYDMEIELDDEDGTLVYEVEFKSGNMEYDYEINAASGAILKHEAEIDD